MTGRLSRRLPLSRAASAITLVAAAVAVAAVAMLLSPTACIPPDWGASALLHPQRRPVTVRPRDLSVVAEDLFISVGDGVTLRGWLARATVAPRRGLVVYLHGVGDNASSAIGLASTLGRAGFDVAAYDARAHGESGGELCTYGWIERRDVGAVLDALAGRGVDVSRVVLLGHSMGAAVAIQAAPDEPRVCGVIALAPFADLEAAAHDMKPWVMTDVGFHAAERRAEAIAGFRIADVSPARSAARLTVPLLILHGDRDGKLRADRHARRILDAAATRDKQLVIIPGGSHEDLFSGGAAWAPILAFLDRVLPSPRGP